MKRKKIGRPKVAKSAFKGVLVGARFSAAEANEVHAAAKQSGHGKSEWIRFVLLGAARSGKV